MSERIEDLPLTLTVEQAGEVLGISRGSAYEAVRAGEIPHLRLGRRIVVPRAMLATLLGEAPRAEDHDDARRSLHAAAPERSDEHVEAVA